MTLDNFNNICNNAKEWANRRMSTQSLAFYKDSKKDWLKCLSKLDDFIKEFDASITLDDWFSICHKYISSDSDVIKMFFFDIWQKGKNYFEDFTASIDLSNCMKSATDEEIKYAKKHFSCVEELIHGERVKFEYTFDNAKVLEYRDNRFIIDNEVGNAWTLDKNNKIKSFQLIWDWYYPIDEYLDLEE